MTPAILWLRRNLRLRDNAALIAAAESGAPLIPVYVLDELDSGGASRWWLHHSLASLDKDFRELGSSIVLLAGSPETVLAQLADQCGATALYYARRFEPEARRQEDSLHASIGSQVDIHAFDDGYLCHHNGLLTKSRTPFRVFTPYWRAAISRPNPPLPKAIPESIRFANYSVKSMSLEDLELLPDAPDWAEGFGAVWMPGEEGGMRRLDDFDSVVRHYAEQRDRPDLDTTSHLSPHLHFGEVSARQVWHAISNSANYLQTSTSAGALIRQLYWRDFSAYLLFHYPTLAEKPLRPAFEHFPWSDNKTFLRAWQNGMTGYPIVDAGMRQLWATGWMHNRVRMIVASFLVKNLRIPWQQGAEWFLDTLVDADLANNSASWQWVAGCGTDAAPYFRIFNPVLQSKKFDPDGTYIRRWVPEIAAIPNQYLHEPWLADGRVGASCSVRIGADYPEPIVDHQETRREALAAYQLARSVDTTLSS